MRRRCPSVARRAHLVSRCITAPATSSCRCDPPRRRAAWQVVRSTMASRASRASPIQAESAMPSRTADRGRHRPCPARASAPANAVADLSMKTHAVPFSVPTRGDRRREVGTHRATSSSRAVGDQATSSIRDVRNKRIQLRGAGNAPLPRRGNGAPPPTDSAASACRAGRNIERTRGRGPPRADRSPKRRSSLLI